MYLAFFVTSMGFKPMTFGTGIQCSIQLSYEAVACNSGAKVVKNHETCKCFCTFSLFFVYYLTKRKNNIINNISTLYIQNATRLIKISVKLQNN